MNVLKPSGALTETPNVLPVALYPGPDAAGPDWAEVRKAVLGTVASRGTPRVQVVVTYDDAKGRARADEVCRHAFGETSPLKLECSWWKFELLHLPALSDPAIEAAVNADLIIYSIHPQREVPSWVKEWAERWRRVQSHKDRILLALIEGDIAKADPRAPGLLYLQNLAAAAQMSFFLRGVASRDETAELTPGKLALRADTMTNLLSEILAGYGPVPHGGINE